MSATRAPSDEAGVVDAVLAARGDGAPLLLSGNATKSAMLRPVQAARSLSTRNLVGVTLYAPQELIIAARAGTPVAEIEAVLDKGGQHLIAEPPDLSALMGTNAAPTIGGVVATNLSGPRRVASGATRDHVMGVRAVNGMGEMIRSGGRVLKNVTGLDLCKLLAGSHGTLGLLTEITLKVLPKPEQTGSLALRGCDAGAGVAFLSAALASPYGVSAAAWLPDGSSIGMSGPVALVRIEDFATSVTYRIGRLVDDLAGHGTVQTLDDAASRRAWRATRDVAEPLAASADDAVWRVSVRPSRGPLVLAALPDLRGFLDWGGGLIWLAGPADETTHGRVTQAARAQGGVWTMMRGPEPLRAAVDVVPPEPDSLARLTRRVKAAMDPNGIFNPGRLFAGV